jgi:hypothetical protein
MCSLFVWFSCFAEFVVIVWLLCLFKKKKKKKGEKKKVTKKENTFGQSLLKCCQKNNIVKYLH